MKPATPPTELGAFRVVGTAEGPYEHGAWEEGVEIATGAPVLVLRHFYGGYYAAIEAIHLAQMLAARPVPGVARIRQQGFEALRPDWMKSPLEIGPDYRPWIVERPAGVLDALRARSFEEAVDLTFQLLEIIGRIHAMGWAPVPFSRASMWIDGDRLTLVLPEVVSYGRDRRSVIAKDVSAAITQLVRWIKPDEGDRRTRWEEDKAALARHIGASSPLYAFYTTPTDARVTAHDVASLLADATGSPGRWVARVAAVPRIHTVRRRFDWDWIIRVGEADCAPCPVPEGLDEWALSRRERRLVEPVFCLARAYQQRARRSWAAGERDGARADIQRAVELDPKWLPYQADREVMLR